MPGGVRGDPKVGGVWLSEGAGCSQSAVTFVFRSFTLRSVEVTGGGPAEGEEDGAWRLDEDALPWFGRSEPAGETGSSPQTQPWIVL